MVSGSGMFDNTFKKLDIKGDDVFILSDMFEKHSKNSSYIRSSEEWDAYNRNKKVLLNNGFGGYVKGQLGSLPQGNELKRRNPDPTLGGKLRADEFVDSGTAFMLGQSKHDIDTARAGGASLGSEAQQILGSSEDPNIGIEKFINERGVEAFKKEILPEIATSKFIDTRGLKRLIAKKTQEENLAVKESVKFARRQKVEERKIAAFQPKIVEAQRTIGQKARYKGLDGIYNLYEDLGMEISEDFDPDEDKDGLLKQLAKKQVLDSYRRKPRNDMMNQGLIEGVDYIFPPDSWTPQVLSRGGHVTDGENVASVSPTGDFSVNKVQQISPEKSASVMPTTTNQPLQAPQQQYFTPETQRAQMLATPANQPLQVRGDDLSLINSFSSKDLARFQAYDPIRKQKFLEYARKKKGS